ncbi:hypothetical protein [Acidisoma sp. 7E03]
MVFIRLVRLMAQLGDASVLRLGFVFGSWKEVAFGLRISETELETHLETLAQRGIIERDETSLTLPDWLGLRDRRAEAARENGKKGGRPRKNAADPRQANILYPLAGGVPGAPGSETQETETETQAETLSRGRPLSPEDSSSEEREEAAVLALLRELAEAGALHQREAGNREAARRWLERGATAVGLREAFMASLRRAKPPRLAPISYFDRLSEDLLARPTAAPATASRPAEQPEDPATAELRRENNAMWRRFVDLEQRNGPCPPSMGRWLAGEVENADTWRAYITEGRSAFQSAA